MTRLLLSAAPVLSNALKPREKSNIVAKSSTTVLAVDDNATIRKAIPMRLQSKGYQVVTAANGESALDLVASRPFDIVLRDRQMLAMRVEDVLERLRIAITSRTDKDPAIAKTFC